MKKLLFISKNLEIGGMEKALVILLNSLIENYEITLILEEKKGTLITDLDSKIKIEEYKLSNWKIPVFRKAYNFIHKNFWKLKNKNKYDFSCNYATYSLIGSYLARQGSLNNSLYVHNDYYEIYKHNKNKFRDFFDSLSIEKFKNIIFVSNESQNNFISFYNNLKNKCFVINNIIDYKHIKLQSTEPIEKVFSNKKLNLLYIGRLDNEAKNFERMFKAMKLVLKENSNVNLYLIGDGPDKNLCLNLIKENKLEDNVFLLGTKKNPYPYLKKCDCLLLTSNYEGYPVVINEALVLNKPCISTIVVSDSEIDLKDYIIKTDSSEENIARAILNFSEKERKNNLNFAKINQQRIEKIRAIIDA